jgi:hypothetical protein
MPQLDCGQEIFLFLDVAKCRHRMLCNNNRLIVSYNFVRTPHGRAEASVFTPLAYVFLFFLFFLSALSATTPQISAANTLPPPADVGGICSNM